jgi:transcriptional regulator with XRE-family HTH domain
MARRPPPVVVNRLPLLLARHGISWSELARRTLLPPRLLARLHAPTANPRLAVAERIAAALDLPVEALWVRRPS